MARSSSDHLTSLGDEDNHFQDALAHLQYARKDVRYGPGTGSGRAQGNHGSAVRGQRVIREEGSVGLPHAVESSNSDAIAGSIGRSEIHRDQGK